MAPSRGTVCSMGRWHTSYGTLHSTGMGRWHTSHGTWQSAGIGDAPISWWDDTHLLEEDSHVMDNWHPSFGGGETHLMQDEAHLMGDWDLSSGKAPISGGHLRGDDTNLIFVWTCKVTRYVCNFVETGWGEFHYRRTRIRRGGVGRVWSGRVG